MTGVSQETPLEMTPLQRNQIDRSLILRFGIILTFASQLIGPEVASRPRQSIKEGQTRMPKTLTVFKVLTLTFAAALILTTEYQRGGGPRLATQAFGEPAQGGDRPYQVVHGWPVLGEGFMLGHVTGVGVDSHNHVFVFYRADHSTLGKTFDGADLFSGYPVLRWKNRSACNLLGRQ